MSLESLNPVTVYHGFEDMPGRSGIRGGTDGCEFELPGRLQHSNYKLPAKGTFSEIQCSCSITSVFSGIHSVTGIRN